MKKIVGICSGIFLLAIFWGLGSLNSGQQVRRIESTASPLTSSLKSGAEYFRLPLYFCPNQGQLDPRVAFIVQGKEKTLYFTSEGITFVLAVGNNEDPSQSFSQAQIAPNMKNPPQEKKKAERWVVKLDFVDADRTVRPVGENKTEAVISYFKGKREEWRTGLSTYSRIVYHDLWPGIDLAYSGTCDRMKYEFIVRPGADPAKIRLAYRGTDRVAVDKEGRLEIVTPLGSFHDGEPEAYQEAGTEKRPVSIAYKLDGFSYGFEIGEYDHALPLILDPFIRVYSGYIGGSSTDSIWGMALDSSGNAYVTGYTVSSETTFPVTTGPDLTYNAGTSDAFVAKVNSSGTALIYCGYIGGDGEDKGCGIAVDSSGNAYVGGYTASAETSFPVITGPDLYFGGGTYDGFVAKVNASGTALDYCGYVGGLASDQVRAIAVDGSGNAYMTGNTASTPPNFPVKTGPDLSHNGVADAFVGKLNTTGTAFAYLGYIGGLLDDYGMGIAVDPSGNAYVAGYTLSTQTTFPVTVGPDLTFNTNEDAFVAKVNAGGTALDYCGYIGGSSYDYGRAIALDRWGCVYITGDTQSTQTTFPEVVGPDLTYNGSNDAFVAKVNATGTGLSYCGYIGGSGSDYGYGIAVDDTGTACIAGLTGSTEPSFPVKVGPDLTQNGSNDAFVAKVSPQGIDLSLCGFIGGSGGEGGYSIALDGWGNLFIGGYTTSTQTTFPVLVGPDLTYNSNTDAFVTRFYSFDLPPSKHCVGDFDGDGSDELAIDFGSSGLYLWDSGVWTMLVAIDSESVIAANLDGDSDDEIIADLGTNGFWVWNSDNWGQLSGANADFICPGEVDGDGNLEIVVDFGASGLWLWDNYVWTQLSGANAEFMITGNLDGSGSEEIIVDFGPVGMWVWSGGAWTQFSAVNADYMLAGNADGTSGEDLIGDFGPVGMWLSSAGAWTQLSGVNADYLILADTDHSGDEELIGDFAFTGLWRWDSGAWENLSGLNLDYMIPADTNGDGAIGVAGDFASLGVWVWDGGAWTQISGVNPEHLMAGDIDGDDAQEIFGDFGSLGLWMWDDGTWSKISASNPD